MLEVEVKLRLDQAAAAALQARLAELGLSLGTPQVQQDTFFTHPERDLRLPGQALRLRRQGRVGPDGEEAVQSLELTHKGPRMPGPGKARTEVTVRLVDDPTSLLAALGYSVAAHVRKHRRAVAFGEVEVAVDQVEGVGAFVEIEAMDSDVERARGRVQAARRELGLESAAEEPLAYVELLQKR